MFDLKPEPIPKEKHKLVVRLSTSYYKSGDSYIKQKSIRTMKRFSDFTLQDVICDIEFDINAIDNLDTVEDGLYQLDIKYEVGGYYSCGDEGIDYMRLIPYKEKVEDVVNKLVENNV